MRYLILFVIATLGAAAVPLVRCGQVERSQEPHFPGWPTHFDGRFLKRLDLSEQEKRFAQDFPGKIAKFSDGTRTIMVRWVARETRKLHPAADCFKGAGYRVSGATALSNSQSSLWGCFSAAKGTEQYHVSERISDNHGNGWPDVSAWYWSAILGKSSGPWWAMTVIEREQGFPPK